MPRRREPCELHPHRSWVWAADAERRWLRAVRLLLDTEPGGCREREGERSDGATGRNVRPGLD